MCTQSCPNLCGPRWTVAHQGPLSMKFSRQDYWSGLSFLPPEGSSQPRGQNHVHGVTKELDMTEQVNKQKETKIFNFTDLKYLYTTWNKYQNILKFYPLFKWLELGAGGPSSQPPAYSPSSLLLSPIPRRDMFMFPFPSRAWIWSPLFLCLRPSPIFTCKGYTEWLQLVEYNLKANSFLSPTVSLSLHQGVISLLPLEKT